jgi:thiol-disulfide isomerase/thioredoxin
MNKKCKRCGQTFRNDTALTRHTKDKHASYYYGIRIIPIALIIGMIITVLYFYGEDILSSNSGGNTPTENIFEIPFPVITGDGLTSDQIMLGDIGGSPIILEFMLSWCHNCQEMVPIMDEVYNEYGSSVFILSIAGTHNGATAESTAEFITEYNATVIHLFDEQNKIFSHFGVTVTPTYLFFNSDGTLANTITGKMTKLEMISEITKLS